jgi:cyclic pyranopterin phosphate synthase
MLCEVAGLNISQQKGVPKSPVEAVLLQEGHGIVGDAHGGSERQVSLLAETAIERMRLLARGLDIPFGAFAENIVIRHADLRLWPVGTVLTFGEVVLEITQIGKECHSGCIISQTTGSCVMPTEGLFARVVKGGYIHVGDTGHYLL